MKLFCESCKHFIGCGDFALCCDIKYNLYYKTTRACNDYVPVDMDKWYELVPYNDGYNIISKNCDGYYLQRKDGNIDENILLFSSKESAEQYYEENKNTLNALFTKVKIEPVIINKKKLMPTF